MPMSLAIPYMPQLRLQRHFDTELQKQTFGVLRSRHLDNIALASPRSVWLTRLTYSGATPSAPSFQKGFARAP
jgi:hypothetical protein